MHLSIYLLSCSLLYSCIHLCHSLCLSFIRFTTLGGDIWDNKDKNYDDDEDADDDADHDNDDDDDDDDEDIDEDDNDDDDDDDGGGAGDDVGDDDRDDIDCYHDNDEGALCQAVNTRQSRAKRESGAVAGIMEADDRQVTTVFTVQSSFHHRHSSNRVS